jgi:hypothetical protein
VGRCRRSCEVIGAREPGDVADVADDFGGDEVPDAADVGDGGVCLGEDLPDLGVVGLQPSVHVSQVSHHVAGEVAAAAVGGGDRPDAAKQRGGLVGGQVQRRAAGNQVPVQDVEAVE